MIYKYLIHFVSVRDNQNVNVEYLIMVTTCINAFYHKQIFKFRL